MNYNIASACELYCIIVNNGLGSKVMKLAKENGITGGTIIIGKGTVKSKWLNALGIDDVRKEIILMAASKTVGDQALNVIYEKMHMDKPHKGIGFSLPLTNVFGSKLNCQKIIKEEDKKMNYNIIITIVDKGKADDVIDAASSAGSTGGTIINGRGSGIHETKKLFNIEIEPEKEVVLIIAKDEVTEKISNAIREKLKIDEPGKGIVFVLEVSQAYGLYNGK